MAKSAFTDEDDALLAELGIEVEAKKVAKLSPKEERIIAGFEEIQNFFDEHGRAPLHGEDRDIFERLYATRLDRIRENDECRTLVEPLDRQSLLTGVEAAQSVELEDIDDDALLAELGIEPHKSDLTVLKHVRTRAEIKAAEEIANRTKCEDFDKFKPSFDSVQDDLDKGLRETVKFRKDAGFAKTDIKQHHFIIVGGQVAYVAQVGETIKAPNGEDDARLRLIYSNGTESDILLRSLIRSMYKDETSRLISNPNAGPLFAKEAEANDLPSGTIYVLRSMSDDPLVADRRQVLHKIGVTGGDVQKRIANAKHDATFLLADVELVATYELFNINRTKLENLIHRIFEPAKLDIDIKDRFGNPVKPREWFLVPLFIIDEVVEKIREGSIGDFVYDPKRANLVSHRK